MKTPDDELNPHGVAHHQGWVAHTREEVFALLDRIIEGVPDGDLPESLPEVPEVIGISSASGPSEHQEEIDQWIEEGGMPEFDDS